MKTYKMDSPLLSWNQVITEILLSFGGILVFSALCLSLLPLIGYRAVGLCFLMAISVGALVISRLSVIVVALTTGLVWDFLFIPPRFTFGISSAEDWMMFISYVLAALVIGSLTTQLRDHDRKLRSREDRAMTLYHLTRQISSSQNLEAVVESSLEIITSFYEVKVTLIGNSRSGLEPFVAGCDDISVTQRSAAEDFMQKWTPSSGWHLGEDFLLLPVATREKLLALLLFTPPPFDEKKEEQRILLENITNQLALGMEREILHQSLREKEVMEETERLYKTLLNSVSHELKTPLSILKGSASTILDAQVLKRQEAVEELAREICLGAERMEDVIQKLLDMSRVESGRIEIQQEPCDLRDVLSLALEKVRKIFPDREIFLQTDTDEVPIASIDYALIEQALVNILHNGLVYSANDQSLEVELFSRREWWVFLIRDYGPGIDEKNLDKIFAKFYRVDPSISGGTGLGLSISKAFVELNGGKIWARNHSQGAEFLLELPSFTQS